VVRQVALKLRQIGELFGADGTGLKKLRKKVL
jgi:hypothetical protein